MNITHKRAELFWKEVIRLFGDYQIQFDSITAQAGYRFENQMWVEQQQAVKQRLELLSDLHARIDWAIYQNEFSFSELDELKQAFNQLEISDQQIQGIHALVAEILRSLGEMSYTIPEMSSNRHSEATLRVTGKGVEMIASLFQSLPWNDKIYHTELLAERISSFMAQNIGTVESILYYPHVFYRNQHAYLVAVAERKGEFIPFILPFIHASQGITCDAVIIGEEAMIQVFSFSRSYFQVRCFHPEHLVQFLSRWMPSKSKAQLFINLGYVDWGKHLLLDELLNSLRLSKSPFHFAPGIRGLVMIVFTFPQANLVLKIIRDVPKPPKEATKKEVISKYNLVATLDRAGRVADAQRYSRIDIPIHYFSDELLQELKEEAPNSVFISEDKVILSDVYLERKLMPMNMYLTEHPDQAKTIISDYGRSIEEMASTNLFPGDLLIKNFGISQEQRVIFYDYDEVCRVTECEFLSLPSNWEEDEVRQQMVVYPHQIFPQEFPKFLLPQNYRPLLTDQFPHLFTPDFWKQVQHKINRNIIQDHAPYVANLL